ncbi:SRPBCC family protein [Candidatus Blastococcus massiliensis]|uniref:SRPBCC family protein n=1 Tax=Candidatus Blastococcus massiliensis TaxID=1470358 RepID=UPI0004B60FAF|nr:SRPBCC family protein [Candidatus Blastococcus massiliensis]
MPTIERSTTLRAPAPVVWNALVADSGAFRFVTRGLIRYPAAAGWAERIRPGQRLSGLLWLFGVLPISRHTLEVVAVDEDDHRLVTSEGGGPVRTWRHTISVTPAGDRGCRYTDHLEIDAGAATPVVVAFARGFYAVRQRRWRSLAPLLGAATR